MKDFREGQTVHIVESDGIALGHYIEYSHKKQGHKVRTHTGAHDYKVIEDDLLYGDYKIAKSRLLSKTFRNKHFKNNYN